MYKIRYLPVARQDMVEIAGYVAQALHNPAAAEHLAVELVEAADTLSAFPYANPVYLPIRPLLHEYRKLLVRNHLLLYWVDEGAKQVTIARVLYARRNYGELLE